MHTYIHIQVVMHRMVGHRGAVLDCDVSRDNMYIVSASADKTLRVWSTDTFVCVNRYVYVGMYVFR
jgi:WD40 repeat protein